MEDESALLDGTEQRRSGAVPPAWWYPDPAKRHDLRYWTGEAWSEFVIDGPTRTPSVDPPVSASTSTAAALRVDSPWEAAGAPEPVAANDVESASTTSPPPSRLRSRLMLAALVVVLVLIAVAGAYLVLGSS